MDCAFALALLLGCLSKHTPKMQVLLQKHCLLELQGSQPNRHWSSCTIAELFHFCSGETGTSVQLGNLVESSKTVSTSSEQRICEVKHPALRTWRPQCMHFGWCYSGLALGWGQGLDVSPCTSSAPVAGADQMHFWSMPSSSASSRGNLVSEPQNDFYTASQRSLNRKN